MQTEGIAQQIQANASGLFTHCSHMGSNRMAMFACQRNLALAHRLQKTSDGIISRKWLYRALMHLDSRWSSKPPQRSARWLWSSAFLDRARNHKTAAIGQFGQSSGKTVNLLPSTGASRSQIHNKHPDVHMHIPRHETARK